MREVISERIARARRRRHSRRARRRIKGSEALNRLLRLTLGPWLVSRYRVTAQNAGMLRKLRPPYLVLPNHCSVWDPFFVNNYVPGVIHYVVSDANFRSKVVEFGLGLVGSIPKTKVMSDLDTVKNIMKVKEAGGIIGIFPEGQNTWDGHTLPIYFSTAKLAKLLKIPVVTARISGAYLSKPRWSKVRRRGKISIRYDLAFTPEQLRQASLQEIDARVLELLDHDDYQFNRANRHRYVGPDRAEYAEIALFTCPQCRAFDTLRSSGNRLGCRECGYTVRLDLYGFFRPVRGTLRFDTVREWNLWQIEELRRRIDAFVVSGSDTPLFTENRVKVEIGYKSMPLEAYRVGRLELYPGRIELTGSDGTRDAFRVERIVGMNVQNNEYLEFYHDDHLFKVTILDPRGCTYKWDLATRFIQERAASSIVV